LVSLKFATMPKLKKLSPLSTARISWAALWWSMKPVRSVKVVAEAAVVVVAATVVEVVVAAVAVTAEAVVAEAAVAVVDAADTAADAIATARFAL
jgi:hypothetical protein